MPKIGLIQMRCDDDVEKNVAKGEKLVREAAAKGASIICLQELFHAFFFPQYIDRKYFNLALEAMGPIPERFSRLACELGAVIVLPIFERAGRGVYHNSAIILDADGSVLGKYRKTHIPFGVLKEKFYFTPGNTGFPVFRTRHGTLGVLICYDRHFPEGARLLALAGAEVILIPNASPRTTYAYKTWDAETRALAITNGLFVGIANRVGNEGDCDYFGRSMLCSPQGDILAEGSEDKDEAIVALADYELIDETRRWWPFFRDRRPEVYEGLVKQHL